jgi:hypothetical protein
MTEPEIRTPPGTAGSPAAGKRAGLAAGPHAVYQAVLRGFAVIGRPPGPAELEQTARRHGITAGQALATLAAADVLGLDTEGQIRMAYPFSASPTPHLVAIDGGPRVHAMCAIDALGIPAMLRADAVITSSDPLTSEPVTVTVRGPSASWDPPGTVVFNGYTQCDGPAEQVTCGYLNFFATAASASQWASQHPEVTGRVIDHARAQALGAQTFGSLLSEGT